VGHVLRPALEAQHAALGIGLAGATVAAVVAFALRPLGGGRSVRVHLALLGVAAVIDGIAESAHDAHGLLSLPLARGGGEGTLHRGGFVVVLAWLDGAPLARRHLLAAATANGSDGVDANVRPQCVPVLRRRIAHAASVAYAWSHPSLHRLWLFSSATDLDTPHSTVTAPR